MKSTLTFLEYFKIIHEFNTTDNDFAQTVEYLKILELGAENKSTAISVLCANAQIEFADSLPY
jgi:hypothetical protein